MPRLLFLLSTLLLTNLLQAQKGSDPKPFADVITAGELRTQLYRVASREFEGRLTGTEGQRKAAAYIEEQFRSWGLQPGNNTSYQLYYPIFRDSITAASIQVDGQTFRLATDFWLNKESNHTETIYGSEVVYANYGLSDSTEDDYKGLDVTGKIVLIREGEPTGSNYRRGSIRAKTETAHQKGAAALLIIGGGFPRPSSFGEDKNAYLNAYKKSIYPNAWQVSGQLAAAILKKEASEISSGRIAIGTYNADVRLEFSKIIGTDQSSDVAGFLEGTDLKDQYVVISAHYDHLGMRDTIIYYGADDDGSGTVSVLQMAKAFAKAKAAGKGPRRSIIFLANSGEEEGLWGSEYYSEHPLYPLDKTTVDLNIDMVGRIDPKRKKGDSTNYVYVIGDDKLSSDLKPISEAQNKKYTHLELDYKYNDPKDPERIYYRSDHYNFARKGVPIIFYFDGVHKDYHRPTDTPDKINYDLMEKRARLVFYTAWEMANMDSMLKRDIPLN